MHTIPGEAEPLFDTEGLYRFPSTSLDQAYGSQQITDVLGSIWDLLFAGDPYFTSFVTARAKLAEQSLQDLTEYWQSLSRQTVPVLHTDLWYHLEILESEINATDHSVARYDGTYDYSAGSSVQYGVPVAGARYEVPLPEGLRNCPLLFNRQSDPSVTLVQGLDFWKDVPREVLSFRENPFNNLAIPVHDVFEGNDVVDRSISLWAFRAQFDRHQIHRHFGYALSRHRESSPEYRELVNAVFDSLLHGPSQYSLRQALGALAGVPVSRYDQDEVVGVTTDRRHQLVLTTQDAYPLPLDATLVVEAGDVLAQGDPLCDAFEVTEFTRGEVPASLTSLALGSGYLAIGLTSDLIFENREVPLEVTTEEDYTRVSFALGGNAEDVQAFWDEVHRRGVAAGQTLAHLLDQRSNQEGEPSAANLPATVNPLHFLAANILRNHVFVVRFRPASFGDTALGLGKLTLLRGIIPPHTGMIVITELVGPHESITLEEAGVDYSETVSWSTGMNPYAEELGPELMTESWKFATTGDTCG